MKDVTIALKVEALKTLELYGYNFNRAAREHGIDRRTLRKWSDELGDQVFSKAVSPTESIMNRAKRSKSVAVEMAVYDFHSALFFNRANEAKDLAVTKLLDILKDKERVMSVRDLTDIVRTMHQLSVVTAEGDAPSVNNFIQQINNFCINYTNQIENHDELRVKRNLAKWARDEESGHDD